MAKYEAVWHERLKLYKEFKEVYGREPKDNETYNNVRIGAWCVNQRLSYNKRKLPKMRFELLKANGFDFTTRKEKFEEIWNYKFQLYKEFKELYDREPKIDEIYKNEYLGKWSARQKENNDNGKLSEEKYKLLSSVNFNFDSSSNYQWNKKYELYKEFKQQYAREPMYSEEYKNINLYGWCRYQRKLNKENKLNEEYKRLLKEACFDFQMKSVNSKLKWDDKYNIYKEYKQLYGHEPNHDEVYKGINLDDWCSNQKSMYNQCKLSKERFKLLNEVGFDFENKYEKQWNYKYEIYKEFKEAHEREPKDNETYNNVRIGAWCATQKTRYKKSKLSIQRTKLLDEAGFIFSKKNAIIPQNNLHDKKWIKKYELYKEFKELYGREPKREEIYKETFIERWCRTQRNNFHNYQLSKDKIKLLEEVGFSFDKLLDEKWIKNFELYKEFKIIHSREPYLKEKYKDNNIGRWVAYQRRLLKRGELEEYKVVLLQNENFIF